MSRDFPKLDRPPLPEIEGEPDWLFKPKNDGRRTSIMEFQDRSIESFLAKLRGASGTCVDEAKSGPKEKLFKLLNHDPSWADERKNYRDEEAREIIKKHPEVARDKYMFASAKEAIFPLSMLAALHASVKTLRACYKANPVALQSNDRWIGTAAHYACAYRAPLAVLEYVVEKDDSILEAKNQLERLPMHLACMVLTPLDKVEFLVKEYKKALSMKDKDGMTPLHHACNRTDPDVNVVAFLAKSNRAACVMQNSKGCTPLHLAVQHQTPINVLQALLAANTDVFSIADGEGNLPVHTALHVNADTSIIQFCVWNHSEGLSHYNSKNERPIDMARRIRQRDKTLWEVLEPY
jgi:ankyrin repeat protein